ncbi:unnamed protein product [Phytomonas sp. EM1]|nr:unnamed protein product [Phytomonas sp. EM1]|eukprot:CCW64515.1 unnamed protein product [Phytomonas sp. isolate EM1]
MQVNQMDALENETLFNLSEQLGSVTTSNPTKLLDDLQMALFGGANLECADVLNRVRGVLCNTHFHVKVLKVKKSATMRQTEHKFLVLEVIAFLGDIFLSVASGEDPSLKVIKRLDQYLLPQLFLTTSVNSELLCEIALKSPLNILHNASQKDPQVRCIVDRLEETLLSWKTNYGCDFLLSRPTVSKDTDMPPSASLLREVANLNTVREVPQHSRRPAAACAVWDASSYSRQPDHRSLLHSVRKIPAYLLTKRQRKFTDEHYLESSSPPLSKSISETSPLNSKEEFSLPDAPSDSGDSDSLAAFETPVKRRRADPSLFVPPSPNRTYEC